jgi:hypothetical protein
MHPARAAAARNIKNVAAGSTWQNKIDFLPFTSKDLDDYYKCINEHGSNGCCPLKSHSLVFASEFWT